MEHLPKVVKGFSMIIKEEPNNDSNDDDSNDESLPLPSVDDNVTSRDDPSNEFHRLTSMVRSMYLAHLHKSLLNNYINCCMKEEDFSEPDLKSCAAEMELNAVRGSLAASLYRQAMLKMISDVKSHTSLKKAHGRLVTFLNVPPTKFEVGVQTEDNISPYEKHGTPDTTFDHVKNCHVQNSSVTSNYDDSVATAVPGAADITSCSLDNRLALSFGIDVVEGDGVVTSKNKAQEHTEVKIESFVPDVKDETTLDMSGALTSIIGPVTKTMDLDRSRSNVLDRSSAEMELMFGTDNAVEPPSSQPDVDGSPDSILQHMEDMFCGSDDSTDLTALIEKHSGVSKANVDQEIGKLCPVEPVPEPGPKVSAPRTNNSTPRGDKRKMSVTSYRKMKKQERGEPDTPEEEEPLEDKKRRRSGRVWLVERINQVSKLKAKMTEIAIRNYRKHGRIKAKFAELFGETDDEEMMPESPIRIEEHLNACKERIAPWVVRHLMPFYKTKRIVDRKLFKSVAKHVADMLIIENTFPEEEDVRNYVQKYFNNRKVIKTEHDIYL